MFWVRESIKHFYLIIMYSYDHSTAKLGQTSRMPQKCPRQQPGPAQNKIVGSVNDTDCSIHNNFELHMLSTSKVSFCGFRYAIITITSGICPQKIKKCNSESPQAYNTHKTIPFIELLDHMHMHSNFCCN